VPDVLETFDDYPDVEIRYNQTIKRLEGLNQGHFKEAEHVLATNEFDTQPWPCRFRDVSMTSTHLGRVGSWMPQQARDLLEIPDYDMDALASQSMAFMMPEISTAVSLVNFAIEAHEIKHLDPRAAAKRIWKSKLNLKLLKLSPKTRKAWVIDTALRFAQAHLLTAFGINPLIADVASTYQGLKTLMDRLKKLKQFAGTPQTRHYKRVLPYENGKFRPRGYMEELIVEGLSLSSFNFYNELLGGYIGRDDEKQVKLSCQWILRPTYHATLRYIYYMPELDKLEEKIRAFLQTLGVNLDPSIIWNAIPYSFLVDWVVDVSGFLRNFAKDTYPIDTRVLEFCHSLTWHKESTASVYQTIDDPSLDPGVYPPLLDEDFQPRQVWRGTDRYYVRRVANPDVSHYNANTSLTTRKAALAGSLLVTKIKPLKDARKRYLRLLPRA